MGCAIVVVQRAGTEIGWMNCLPDYVRFSDPGTLRVREDDGHDVAGFLEGLYQRVDIRRGLV